MGGALVPQGYPMNIPTFLLPHDALHQSVAVIGSDEFRHLRARRVRAGDLVRVIDGRGTARLARVQRVSRDHALVKLEDTLVVQPESPLKITLALALMRPERLEIVLEKATELGVHKILLFRSARSRTYDPTRRVVRWQRILSEATKQCQRTWVPELELVSSLEAVLPYTHASVCTFFHVSAAPEECLDLASLPSPTTLFAAVGPEGGFSDNEARLLREHGCIPARLGPRILRTETAALAAIAITQFLWGDLRLQRQME